MCALGAWGQSPHTSLERWHTGQMCLIRGLASGKIRLCTRPSSHGQGRTLSKIFPKGAQVGRTCWAGGGSPPWVTGRGSSPAGHFLRAASTSPPVAWAQRGVCAAALRTTWPSEWWPAGDQRFPGNWRHSSRNHGCARVPQIPEAVPWTAPGGERGPPDLLHRAQPGNPS